MTAHVFDAVFRFAFLPTVLLVASVFLVRNIAALFSELRAESMWVDPRKECAER